MSNSLMSTSLLATDDNLGALLAGAAPAGQPWRLVDGGIAHGMLAMDAVVFGNA